MSIWTKSSNFGHKGVHDKAQSLAEQLLTGKPLARAPGVDRTPKLKPRRKPVFGRKAHSSQEGPKRPRGAYFTAGLVAGGFCVAVIAQIIVAS